MGRAAAGRSGQRAKLRNFIFHNRRREYRGSPLIAGAAAAKRPCSLLRLPALEGTDAPGIHQISGESEVEAAGRTTSLFNNTSAARKVQIALFQYNDGVSSDDDHVSLFFGQICKLIKTQTAPPPLNLEETRLEFFRVGEAGYMWMACPSVAIAASDTTSASDG